MLGLVALVVAVAAASVLVVRPNLTEKEDAVDDAWVPLYDELLSRYDALSLLAIEVGLATGEDRDVVSETEDALARWAEVDDRGVEAQVVLANELEGLAARLGANIQAAPRLAATPAVVAALDAFRAAALPQPAVDDYNDAVAAYDDARTSITGQPVADIFGFDARTAFAPVT